jgi:hypothetical protein
MATDNIGDHRWLHIVRDMLGAIGINRAGICISCFKSTMRH